MGNQENGFTYDEVNVDGKNFKFRSGEKNLYTDLIIRFPHEKNNIEKYFNLLKRARDLSLPIKLKVLQNSFLRNVVIFFLKLFKYEYYDLINKNVDEMMNEIFNDKKWIGLVVKILIGITILLFGLHILGLISRWYISG